MSTQRPGQSRAAGVLLGVGMGGFVDGIVLHQILQWHHMLTSEGDYPATTVAGLETNTLWDGLFHAFTWAAVGAGIWLLWREAGQHGWSLGSRGLLGWMLIGWGAFNLIEGVVDHQILGIHHVRDDLGGPLSWDLAFLALGVLLVITGWMLARSADQRRSARR